MNPIQKESQFEAILVALSDSHSEGRKLRKEAMKLLGALETYDWSGVYRLHDNLLVLDAYVGDETDHVQIPVGTGVCGTAVAEDKNQVVGDVRELANYLSCSAFTRSEIVVLIRNEFGQVLGQIDVDGHRVDSFDDDDERFLEQVGKILAVKWE